MSTDGIIQTWNPGAERMFGYTADEVIGKSERLLFAEDGGAEFEEKYRHLRHGEHVLRDTVRRRKDGSMLDVAINVAPMRRPVFRPSARRPSYGTRTDRGAPDPPTVRAAARPEAATNLRPRSRHRSTQPRSHRRRRARRAALYLTT